MLSEVQPYLAQIDSRSSNQPIERTRQSNIWNMFSVSSEFTIYSNMLNDSELMTPISSISAQIIRNHERIQDISEKVVSSYSYPLALFMVILMALLNSFVDDRASLQMVNTLIFIFSIAILLMGVFDQKRKQTEWKKVFGWKGKQTDALIKVQIHQEFNQPELIQFLHILGKSNLWYSSDPVARNGQKFYISQYLSSCQQKIYYYINPTPGLDRMSISIFITANQDGISVRQIENHT